MICGVDEAGRGPVIGPMVIAGVNIEKDDKLRKIGVKDSKKLTPPQREKMAEQIKDVADCYIEIITANEIDELRKNMTLNVIEINGYIKVIQNLKPNKAFVDAVDVYEERFGNDILKHLDFDVEIISKHKADTIFPVVSAASIIAKTRRDEEIEKISRKIGMDIGSGYPRDPYTVNFLKKYVYENGKLPPHTRSSWKTSKNVLKDYHNKYKVTQIEQFMEE